MAHHGDHHHRPQQNQRRRRPSELVISLPLCGWDDQRRPPPPWSGWQRAQGVAGCHIPVHQRLRPRVPDVVAHKTCHQRFSPPDADGWSEVLSSRAMGSPQLCSAAPRQDPPPRCSLPAQLDGHCLNCLSYNYCRATCTRPTRCMRCFKPHHITREFKRLRRPPSTSIAVGAAHLPRHEGRHRREVFSAALPRTSDTAGSSSREEVPPQWSAVVEPTPSPRGLLYSPASHLRHGGILIEGRGASPVEPCHRADSFTASESLCNTTAGAVVCYLL
jgi:hypothetical protein